MSIVFRTISVILLGAVCGVLALGVLAQTVFAQPSYTLNYQGKLTDNTGLAVANGTYAMEFKLYTQLSGGAAIWTETYGGLPGTTEVTVTNGLFSVMLGSVTPLTSVNFNQPLYLGVNIESDGEMSPRKIIGTVPSAFEAQKVGGVASSSFLRSDTADSASGLLTFTGGLISTASSTVARLSFLNATGTSLYIGGDRITEFAGTGLALSGTTLTTTLGTDITAAEIANGDHGFFSYASGVASLDTGGLSSADLAAALTNETGIGGGFVRSANPTLSDATIISQLNVDAPLVFNSTGVRISTDTDGAITFLGLGDGSDEDLTLNLDDTANTGVFTSSTGLNTINFSGISLLENGAAVLNVSDVDTCSEIATALGTDATGTCGDVVLSVSPTITGTADFVAGDFSSTLTMSGSAANIALGSNWLSGDGADEGIFVGSTGNVGIGTSTLGTFDQLTLTGAQRFNSANATIMAKPTTGYVADLTLGAGRDQFDGTKGAYMRFRSTGTGDGEITFSTTHQGVGGGTRMTLTKEGNFGIGTTSPYAKLSVAGNSAFTGQLNMAGTAANIALGSNFLSGDGDDEGLSINGAGRGSFAAGLSVATDLFVGNSADIRSGGGAYSVSSGSLSAPDGNAVVTTNDTTTNGSYSGISFNARNSSALYQKGYIGVVSNSGGGVYTPHMVFGLQTATTSYQEYIRIASGGNVGIGTSSPASKLTVAGDLRVTGAFRDASGDAGTNGQVLLSTLTGTNWVATSSLGIGGSIAADSLDFDDFADALTIDANTTISATGGSLTIGNATSQISINDPTYTLNSNGLVMTSGYGAFLDDRTSDYVGTFINDGNNANRYGLLVQGGLDNSASAGPSTLLQLNDGDGGSVGTIGFGASALRIDSAESLLLNSGFAISINAADQIDITSATTISIDTANFGVSPSNGLFSSIDSASDYAGSFYNDGNNINRYGILVQAGLDNLATGGPSRLIQFNDGDGTSVGSIDFGSNQLQINSANEIQIYPTNTLGLYSNDLVYIDGPNIIIGTASTVDINGGNFTIEDTTGAGMYMGGDASGYVADFVNDGNNVNRSGVLIQAGLDNFASVGPSTLLQLNDGDGTSVGSLGFGGGAFLISSGSNVLSLNGALTLTPGVSIDFEDYTYFNDTVELTGALVDGASSAGTNGMVLQTTGTGVQWVATSSLGISGSLFTDGGANTYLTATGDNLSIGGTGGSAKLNVYGNIDVAQAASGISFMGTRMFYASTTNDSVSVGELAGATFTSATTYNVALGFEAGRYASTTNADYNNYTGYQAGRSNRGSTNNLFGYLAGTGNTGSNNNIFGSSAGTSNTGFGNNIFGQLTAQGNTGHYNNILGYQAGYSNRGSYNNMFGSSAGWSNTGNYNEMIGYQSGYYLQSTSTVAIGAESLFGSHNTTYISLNNVALGYRAGYASNDGSGNNIFLGYQAGDNLTTGNNNIIIGYDIDNVTATADNRLNIGNLIFGTGLDGTGTTLASGNVGIGTSSPAAKLDVWGNFRVGTSSTPLMLANTAARQVGFGTASVLQTVTGETPLVTLSGNYLTRKPILYLNEESVESADSGRISFGRTSMAGGRMIGVIDFENAGEISAETDVGDSNAGSLRFLTDAPTGGSGLAERMRITSSGNVGIGTTSPYAKLSVNGNLALTGGIYDSGASLGSNGMVLLSTGSGIDWVATSSLGIGGGGSLFTDGGANTYLTATGDNLSIGGTGGSAKLNVYGNIDVAQAASGISFMGTRMFYASTTNDSIAIGEGAGASFTTGATYNTALGFGAGGNITTADDNIFVGYNSGYNGNGLSYASVLGHQAGYEATGVSSTIIGQSAGYSFDGNSNVAIGTEAAGYANGDYAVVIGYRTAYGATTTIDFSNLIGYNAAYNMNGGTNNVFGSFAAENLVGGSNNIMGFAAGNNAVGGSNNFMGSYAGSGTVGSYNNFIGEQAGRDASGSYNSYYGTDAGRFLSGDNNSVVGTFAMTGDVGAYTGSNNTAIGYGAGYYAQGDADGNVLIGAQAGEALTTGDFNIVLGYDIDLPNNAGNNQLNIGNIIYGTSINGSNTTLSTGNIGIGTTTPYAKFSVTNTGSGNSFVVEDSSSDATPFVITASGDVGVGTIAPARLFHVSGVGRFGKGEGGSLELVREDSVTTAGELLGELRFGTTDGANYYGLISAFASEAQSTGVGGNYLTFGTVANGASSVSERMRIDANGNIGIGSTTPNARLGIQRTGFTGAGVMGTDQWYESTNSTLSAVQYGNRNYLDFNGTATTTLVGSIFRIADDTTYGNTVRGLEVQTNQGSNPYGENTAISGSGRTFGIRGITSGNAGSVFEPAGGFFQTNGTAQGNAVRGYSSTITSATLLSLFQDTSAFTGTGLEMNFGNTSGSFNNAASKFIDLQNAGTSAFTISAYGTTTIGNGTNYAGLQIGRGGICVDNDGACTAGVSGRIASVSSFTGNSDLAEMYFSSTWLETGEIVTLKGELSVERAQKGSELPILGVVSTKPGLLLGADDTSLTEGERGYPVALRGRVPIKLSTENGPIKKGDPLTLSSIPGTAMKATDGGVVVGTALEDFDDSRMFSDTYINQFGDDIAEEMFEPIVTNDDPRIHDGCYFGGGAETGDTPCVPLVGYTPEQQLASANEIIRDDVVRGLRQRGSETEMLENGQEVKVGQIVMFVDLNQSWFAKDQMASLASLFATSSITNFGDNESETIFDRVKNLANNFVDGVLSVFKLKADRVEIKEELCVDDVCIDANDLRELLDKNNINGSAPSPDPEPEEPPVEESSGEEGGSGEQGGDGEENPPTSPSPDPEEPPVEEPEPEPSPEPEPEAPPSETPSP